MPQAAPVFDFDTYHRDAEIPRLNVTPSIAKPSFNNSSRQSASLPSRPSTSESNKIRRLPSANKSTGSARNHSVETPSSAKSCNAVKPATVGGLGPSPQMPKVDKTDSSKLDSIVSTCSPDASPLAIRSAVESRASHRRRTASNKFGTRISM